MDKASINVEIVTIYCGQLVKNKVVLEVPQEAAEIISKAWNTDVLPQRKAITAHNLMDNQVANFNLVIGNKVVGGMCNI